MRGLRIGAAFTGSFCTFAQVIPELKRIAGLGCEIFPIMSEAACSTDTRFGRAADWVAEIERVCGRSVFKTIAEAEPIGPMKTLDLLAVAPCTGNTLGKLAAGISDTSVTFACKAHLRNDRPVVIALSTNDALSASAKAIGTLMARRNIYFVPVSQDDCENKPSSAIANFGLLYETIISAYDGKQLQPMLM